MRSAQLANQDASGERRVKPGISLRRKESDPPFPVSPLRGKPGWAGSPHAATRAAPAKTAGTSRAAAPPIRGDCAPPGHSPLALRVGSRTNLHLAEISPAKYNYGLS